MGNGHGVLPSCARTWIIVLLVLLLLSSAIPLVNTAEEELDSDYDGWSDEYERTMGTDPHNPDTDGDGIEDPDDPTPKGSLVNEEELWETFDVTITPSLRFATEGELMEVEVMVEKNDIPIAGRTVWLFVYLLRDEFTKHEEHSAVLSDGRASFPFRSADPGEFAFLAIVNRSTVSPGQVISSGEMGQIQRRMQGNYRYFSVYPTYTATISSHYRYLLAGQEGTFFIQKWKFSPEMAAEYQGSYPSVEDIYEPVPGKVYVGAEENHDDSDYTIQVAKEGSTWSHVFTSEGGHTVAVSANPLHSSWAENPGKFPYHDVSVSVRDPLATWLENPERPMVGEEHSIRIHKVYLDPGMGAELFDQLYRKYYSVETIARMYPEHTTPWTGSAYLSLLYYRSPHALLLKQEAVSVNGVGEMNYLYDTPGNYHVTYSFSGMPAYPENTRFDLYDFHHDRYIYLSYPYSSSFSVGAELTVSVFSGREVFFTGEDCGVVISAMDRDGPSDQVPVALYLGTSYLTTLDLPDSGVAEYSLEGLPRGERDIIALPLFSANTKRITDIMGISEMVPQNWIAETTIYVRNLAIYSHLPYYLILGHQAPVQVLVYGEGFVPLENASVTLKLRHRYSQYSNPPIELGSGTTDASGSFAPVLSIPVSISKYYDYDWIRITAEKDGRTEQVEYRVQLSKEDYHSRFTLNKPIYRGGDTVHARFLLWKHDALEPFTTNIEARLIDPYDRTIIKTQTSTDSYGYGSVDFSLPSKLPWGEYRIRLETDGPTFSTSFEVKEYDLPETRISFDEAPSEATPGQEVTVPLKVEYMFGAPVTEGTVEFTVTEYRPYIYRPWWYYGEESIIPIESISFGEGDDGDDEEDFPIRRTVEVENGWANLTFEVPEDAGNMKVEAEFSDRFGHGNSGLHILNTGSTPAGASLSVELELEEYLPDQGIPCTVSFTKDEEPVPDADINVTITAEDADWVKREHFFEATTDGNGEYVFDVREKVPYQELLKDGYLWFTVSARPAEGEHPSGEDDFVVHSIMGVIETDGTDYTAGEDVSITFGEYDLIREEWAATSYTLEVSYQKETDEGSYWSSTVHIPFALFSGTLEDEGGVTLSIPEHMPMGSYRIKGEFERTEVEHVIQVYTRDQRVSISSEAESFTAGENIPVHITTTGATGKWLYVDVVSGPSLVSFSVFLDGPEVDMDIPTGDHRSPTTVSAYFISEHGTIVKDTMSFEQDIPEFRVNLTTDRDTYGPGDLAYLNLTVTDNDGAPVPDLMVCLSIVDAAVFELEEDSNENGLFSRYMTSGEQERYYRLRANFAYVAWYPEELTERSESFWPRYGWGNATKDEDDYDRWLYAGAEADGANGSGGGFMPEEAMLGDDLGAALEEADIRSDFRETAFWLPGLEIENGTYSWEIPLPQNLANWRVKLIASTENCLGAVETFHFNTSKDFFVSVTIPHRVTQDDEFTLVARIHNFNQEELDISMGLTAGPWLNVFGDNEMDFTMAGNSVREVLFKIKVLEPGLHNLTLIATDFGEFTDAIRRDMTVRPNGALKTTHLSGSVEDSATMSVEFLPELVAGSEEVVLRLAVGYEGLLEEGARMLGRYPYGCTEQVMSVLLPNVLLYEHYTLTGAMTSQMRRYYRENIYKGILKLLSNQHPDGGWGWWKTDRTDNFMTAYVLFGLSRARDAGFHVSDEIIEEAQDALLERRNGQGVWAPADWMGENHVVMTLYAGYALASSGFSSAQLETSLNTLEGLLAGGEIDDPYELSLYALLLQELGLDESAVLDALVGVITVSHWQAGSSLGGGDETTAWASYALTRANRDKAIVRGALEWLAEQRLPGGGWGTTSDTIASLILINEVIKTSEKPDMDVTVKLNGETLISRHVDDSYESQHEFRSALDALKLNQYLNRDGANEITIERTGKGELFYELTTVQYLRKGIGVEHPEDVTAKENEAFEIEVTVKPEASDNVRIESMDVLIPEHDALVLVSSEASGSGDEERTFTFTYMGSEEGEYLLGPMMISYTLEAGERRSTVIREYFEGVDVSITSGSSRTRGGTDPFPETTRAGPEDDLSVVKILSGSPAVIGEPVDVVVIVSIPDALTNEEITIKDGIPGGFSFSGEMAKPVNGELVIVSRGELVVEFTYTLTPEREYSGTLPRTLVLHDGELVAWSNSPALRAIRNDEIAVERVYSTHTTDLNAPVSVSLYLRAPEGLSYAAVEDILPPGARVLEDSVEANLDENVLSYTIAGEKVVFFISEVRELTLQYQFVPALLGEFAIPSAELYSMYETEQRAESGSDYLKVTQAGEGAGPDMETTDLVVSLKTEESPEGFAHGEETVFVVTIYNLGPRNMESVPVSLYMDDTLMWRDSVSVPFYSSKEIRVPWIPEEGEHTIRIVVDDLDMVDETSTENNAVEFTVEVGDAESEHEFGAVVAFLTLSIFVIIVLIFIVAARPEAGGKEPSKADEGGAEDEKGKKPG